MEMKHIALYGRPDAGKLTAAIAMAKNFAKNALNTVIISANNYEPKMDIVFPQNKSVSKKKSIGELLILPQLREDEVFQNFVPLSKRNDGIYILGYKNGDNPFTYTEPVRSQLDSLFAVLRASVDIVISVPVPLFWMGELSKYMLAESDLVYYLHELSPQSLAFDHSRNDQLAHLAQERQHILSKVEKQDMNLIPAHENEIGPAKFRLPFADEITGNYKNGQMQSDLTTAEGKAYAQEIERMCSCALGRQAEDQEKKGRGKHGRFYRKS